jgi:hypothetical protein
MAGDGTSPIWNNVPSDTSHNVIGNPEPHGATYDLVMKDPMVDFSNGQGAHWMGPLLPPAIPGRDAPRAHEFFSGMSVLGDDNGG